MTNSNVPSNPWFGISMGLIGVIVGYGIAMGTLESKPSPTQPPSGQQAQVQPQAPEVTDVVAPDSDVDHINGNVNATISLIEYSDFECPFCQRHHPTMQQALDEYGDEVNWVYRHYPLPFHANARPAALASECVADMAGNEAFWDFVDIIFERGPDQASLAEYAEDMGLDDSDFQDCMESEKFGEKVDEQLAEGTSAGVKGTPGTIVYNNKTEETRYISGAQPYANVKAAIDELL